MGTLNSSVTGWSQKTDKGIVLVDDVSKIPTMLLKLFARYATKRIATSNSGKLQIHNHVDSIKHKQLQDTLAGQKFLRVKNECQATFTTSVSYLSALQPQIITNIFQCYSHGQTKAICSKYTRGDCKV